jgi:hypothetical protein
LRLIHANLSGLGGNVDVLALSEEVHMLVENEIFKGGLQCKLEEVAKGAAVITIKTCGSCNTTISTDAPSTLFTDETADVAIMDDPTFNPTAAPTAEPTATVPTDDDPTDVPVITVAEPTDVPIVAPTAMVSDPTIAPAVILVAKPADAPVPNLTAIPTVSTSTTEAETSSPTTTGSSGKDLLHDCRSSSFFSYQTTSRHSSRDAGTTFLACC